VQTAAQAVTVPAQREHRSNAANIWSCHCAANRSVHV